jgi:hypothetical protein
MARQYREFLERDLIKAGCTKVEVTGSVGMCRASFVFGGRRHIVEKTGRFVIEKTKEACFKILTEAAKQRGCPSCR